MNVHLFSARYLHIAAAQLLQHTLLQHFPLGGKNAATASLLCAAYGALVAQRCLHSAILEDRRAGGCDAYRRLQSGEQNDAQRAFIALGLRWRR